MINSASQNGVKDHAIYGRSSLSMLNTDTFKGAKKEWKITYRKLVLGILRPLDSPAFEAAALIFQPELQEIA